MFNGQWSMFNGKSTSVYGYLSWQSITGKGRRRQDLQTEIRSSFAQPTRAEGGYDAVFYHLAESRLCGR